jgi:adenine-specific DNA-methyltransferase
VQISDENLHHVRELMDEVFGGENFVSQVSFKKTGGLDTGKISTVCDFIIWFARDIDRLKYRPLFVARAQMQAGLSAFRNRRDADGQVVAAALDEAGEPLDQQPDAELFQTMALSSQGASANSGHVFRFDGKDYRVPHNKHWRFSLDGLDRLATLGRIVAVGENIRAVSYLKDFPFGYLNNIWTDTGAGSFLESQLYVVQTGTKVIQRCLLMTTDPGDLVLDPACGSGTTAYVAEQWGRRWITIDTSRVPLALARQRLLTATFPREECRSRIRHSVPPQRGAARLRSRLHRPAHGRPINPSHPGDQGLR